MRLAVRNACGAPLVCLLRESPVTKKRTLKDALLPVIDLHQP